MEQTQTDDHGLPTIWTPERHYRTARVSPPPFPGLTHRGTPSRSHPRIARMISSSVVPD
jgi:hypothetical protein